MSEFKMTVPEGYDTTDIQHHEIRDFQFHNGDKRNVHIAYRQFNPTETKIVVIPTCFSGRINNTLNYTEGALAKRRVIVMAMLGNGESSSPSNMADFPAKLDYRDVIRAHHTTLTEALKINHIESVIGFSMGGQQAYYWTKLFPSFLTSVVSICSSAQTSAHNYAFLDGPATALLHSSDYASYEADGTAPVKGLQAFGRAWCAWLFSPAWFRAGHWRSSAPTMEEFLKVAADNGFINWDAHDLLATLRMWQHGDIATFRDDASLETALADIPVPVLLMPSRSDAYFDWHDSEREIQYLKAGSKLEIIESVWGHTAGGSLNPEDVKWVDGRLAEWLDTH